MQYTFADRILSSAVTQREVIGSPLGSGDIVAQQRGLFLPFLVLD